MKEDHDDLADYTLTAAENGPHSMSISPTTGKKFDHGKAPMGLLPPKALKEVALVMEFGAKKYGKHNYLAGMDWSRLYDALLRHVNAFVDGEDTDPETGLSHMAHASCCALFLLEYIKRDIGTDDRYVQSN